MMKIISVTYRKLESASDYSHRAMEATALVNEGEDPALVLNDLQVWVHEQLKDNTILRGPDVERIRSIMRELENAVDQASIPF
jgi:hypothetical protein